MMNYLSKLILLILVLVLSATGLYFSTFKWLLERYLAPDSYYSHGLLIPVLVAFLLWTKRTSLKLQLSSSWAAIWIICLALFIELIASLTEVYLLSELSLFVFCIGVAVLFWGLHNFRVIRFPLLFLVFMFPLPQFLINYITYPLRIWATQAAVLIMKLWGLPVSVRGFEIIFPRANLFVDTPCSGLRSLITFFMLSALFAQFINTNANKKALMFFAACPIALLTNLFRIIVLSFIAFVYGSQIATKGFWHDFTGFLSFSIGFIFLCGIRKAILWKR